MERNKTKGKQKKKVILDYRSWQIVLEPNFPSDNYILMKKNGVRRAYCGSLESALKLLFDQLIIANINSSYGKKLVDLRRVITQTKKELEELVYPAIKTSYVLEKGKTHDG